MPGFFQSLLCFWHLSVLLLLVVVYLLSLLYSILSYDYKNIIFLILLLIKPFRVIFLFGDIANSAMMNFPLFLLFTFCTQMNVLLDKHIVEL